MKYIYKAYISILIFLFCMFECQALQIAVCPFSTDTLYSKGNTLFCMFRHAPTSANQGNIVQGRSIDNEILEYIPEKNKANYSILCSLLFDIIVANTQRRTLSTAKLLPNGPKIVCDDRFDEQDLGPFEGQNKYTVLSDPQFQQLFTHPEFRMPRVEPGIEVIERVLQGIESVAKKDSRIGICTSQCLMNWFLKWANNDYSRFYVIKNFDLIFFIYNKANKIITVLPNAIGLETITFLFNSNLGKNIFSSGKINAQPRLFESKTLFRNKLGIREAEKMNTRLIASPPYKRSYNYRRMIPPHRGS